MKVEMRQEKVTSKLFLTDNMKIQLQVCYNIKSAVTHINIKNFLMFDTVTSRSPFISFSLTLKFAFTQPTTNF